MKVFKSLFLLFLSIFVLISCKKDSSNPAAGNTNPVTGSDISGQWIVTETENGNCSGTAYPKITTAIYDIEVNGTTITITRNNSPESKTGTINGLFFTFTEDETDEDGTTHIEFSGSVTADGKNMSGTATWTYTSNDQTYSCSGITQLSGSRLADADVSISGKWGGSWTSTETTGLSGTFEVNFVQDNNLLSGSISVPAAGLSQASLKGVISGHTITFGDIEEIITFTGTIGDDSISAEGNYNYSAYDSGVWQCARESGSISATNVLAVIDSFKLADNYSSDITTDGNYIWVLSGESIYCYGMDGSVVNIIDTPGNYPEGLAFDGQNLICGDNNWGFGKIFKLAPDGSSVLNIGSSRFFSSIAISDGTFWALNNGGAADNDYIIYQFDVNSEVIDSFNCPGIFASGLAVSSDFIWVKTMIDGDGYIFKFNHSGSILDTIEVEVSYGGGIAYDGSNLWYVTSYNNRLNKIDDEGNVLDFIDCPEGIIHNISYDGSNLWVVMTESSNYTEKIFKLDGSGSILQTLDPPCNNSVAIAFNGAIMTIYDQSSKRLFNVDPSSINYFNHPEVEFDRLSYSDGKYWAIKAGDNTVYNFDENGNYTTAFTGPFEYAVGIDVSNESVWVLNSLVLNENKLFEFDESGNGDLFYDGGSNFPVPANLVSDGLNFYCTGNRIAENNQYLYKLTTFSVIVIP